MIDVAVRLLSLSNQLDQCTRRVHLVFEEGDDGVMGYLNRMGFFDFLAPSVVVEPARPPVSGAVQYAGKNPGLVEIAAVSSGKRDKELPSRLTKALVGACRNGNDGLEGAAWTIFAELVSNIFDHSQTPLDGYAALQLYSRSKSLKVAVSDSGLGLIETLRPTLRTSYPSLARLSEVDLLVRVFQQGVSRHGADRGCGLKGSAEKALKYNASLDVRLPTSRVVLTPGHGGYEAARANFSGDLALLWGTHICFTFRLDGRPRI